MVGYEELRARHVRDLGIALPGFVERLRWSPSALRAQRGRELRRLVAVAAESAPWHSHRLRGLDPAAVTEEALPGVPVMTKDDLVAHFDGIVTDPRLRRGTVEEHLADLDDDAYLLEEFHVFASGGASGRRGVFVYDWDAWTSCAAGILRWRAAWQRSIGRDRLVMGSVSAGAATHMTAALVSTFSSPRLEFHRFPVTRPLGEIVAGLNGLQPDVLHGYPSALRLLALEAVAGRLAIAPIRIVAGSEPLLPETRELLTSTWGVSLENVYAASEAGGIAGTCVAGGLHLNDDLLILEPVDADGTPTPVGDLADKLYLTNLYNRTLPLIRYELDDQIRVLPRPCACGSGNRLIEDVHGRSNDVFTYPGGVLVHPLVFSTVLGRSPQVAEYQVLQRPHGAEVLVQPGDRLPDLAALGRALRAGLADTGMAAPQVQLRVVSAVPRLPTGKVRRFVPHPLGHGSPAGHGSDPSSAPRP